MEAERAELQAALLERAKRDGAARREQERELERREAELARREARMKAAYGDERRVARRGGAVAVEEAHRDVVSARPVVEQVRDRHQAWSFRVRHEKRARRHHGPRVQVIPERRERRDKITFARFAFRFVFAKSFAPRRESLADARFRVPLPFAARRGSLAPQRALDVRPGEEPPPLLRPRRDDVRFATRESGDVPGETRVSRTYRRFRRFRRRVFVIF